MVNDNKYALLSVSDKKGIVELAQVLIKLNYQLISTGGTAKILQENKISVIPIQKITGNPESFDGRIKTISFQVGSGILFDRTKPEHVKEAKEMSIKPIDIVVCNLYPFERTVADYSSTHNEIIENIDVGGPTMIRAAAKNFKSVLVIVDPKDYEKISLDLIANNISEKMRQELSAKAFYHLSFYDSQIARFLNKELFPKEVTIPGRKVNELRYGENPHQSATFYLEPNTVSPLKNLKHHWGRKLSLVNLTDINAGIELIRLFKEPAAVIIKHNTPCGISLGENPAQALSQAIKADPQSAFGGVIVLNRSLDIESAKIVAEFKDVLRSNIDIIAVPSLEDKALKLLAAVRKSMGIYTFDKIDNKKKRLNIKWVYGGFIVQTTDDEITSQFNHWSVVTKKKPTKLQLQQMKIAWKFVTKIQSNTIIIMDKKLPMTRGIGSGQTSRVRSVQIALEQANKYTKGAVLASDSYFPFNDSVKLAAKYGIAAIVQEGRSINDQDSIDTANKFGIAMIFTNYRAFWH